jgi:hypothetical protein
MWPRVAWVLIFPVPRARSSSPTSGTAAPMSAIPTWCWCSTPPTWVAPDQPIPPPTSPTRLLPMWPTPWTAWVVSLATPSMRSITVVTSSRAIPTRPIHRRRGIPVTGSFPSLARISSTGIPAVFMPWRSCTPTGSSRRWAIFSPVSIRWGAIPFSRLHFMMPPFTGSSPASRPLKSRCRRRAPSLPRRHR